MNPIILPFVAYLLGSIPAGLIVGRLRGIDIREHGSGNIGATNVFRVLGKSCGVSVFLFDFLKGFLPVMLAISLCRYTNMENPMSISSLHSYASTTSQLNAQLTHVFCALAAILGHNFPVWLNFKGGKGIATSAGALCALMPAGIVLIALIWAAVFFTTKYVSLASIVAAISLPLITLLGSLLHGKLQNGTWNKPLFVLSLMISFLAIWRHRSNIQRLRSGTENRAFSKKDPS